ncbi:aminoglycoside phosphotransferase family protein [Streptomyces sp. NPDC050803]|uniref:aminoglycoside phosphotransferase family protein n=1 Tax=unclassified Streptomyces TaxID=2593676 RepID=UPI00342F0E3A
MTQGHHNLNHTAPLTEPMARLVEREPGTLVTVRTRRTDALPVVIRTWPDEAALLQALSGQVPHAPECLYWGRGTSVYSYAEGMALSVVCPNGKPVDDHLVTALTGFMAGLTKVRKDRLPSLAEHWPRNGKDSAGYLRALAQEAERQIRLPNWAVFGGLFASLGIPADAMMRYAERVPALCRRPHSLLHADLHRDNVILPYGDDPPLICVDWELAGYGDPLHDLATHLVRMQYPEHQWDEVIDRWAQAMEEVRRPEAVNGLGRDLRHYIAFERAQSVYPDVMRAASELGDALDTKKLEVAAGKVQRAVVAAAGPLRLARVPEAVEIERILFRWWASALGPRTEIVRRVTPISWDPDERVPERLDFPRSAVHRALDAEGAAPASRVFKGATHLNTVVQVEGADFPVVVRRAVASQTRRERGFLDEHAVLRAIEKSPETRVRVPRVLALGTSNFRDQFAIHSYEGPASADRSPRHPVDGLSRREADQLVEQLVALTLVDHEELVEDHDRRDFYTRLSGELVRLVGSLPPESKVAARELGLPDSGWLAGILGRHRVTRRQASLLHGDLNPWNIVLHDDGKLTIIDWEMAMIGDPLYDLVRHIHLTPVKASIRERMYALWSSRLPPDSTKGWEEDRRLYRWIEIVRSAYIDLDRLVTRASLDAPNVQRALSSYPMTLNAARAALGLSTRQTSNRYLARLLQA